MNFIIKYILVYSFYFGLFSPLFGQTFTKTSNVFIGDLNIVFDTLSITDSFFIMNSNYGLEKVCLNIDHNATGNLIIDLISPNDVTVNLFYERGGIDNDLINTCFNGDILSDSISKGIPPFTGDYQPEEPLGLINDNSTVNGDWVLKIYDSKFLNTGTLIDFSLTFSNNPAIVPGIINDDCVNSTPLVINSAYQCLLITEGSINGATNSNITGCSGFDGFDDDAWFHFIAEDEEHIVNISNILGCDLGSCDSRTCFMIHGMLH